MSEQEKRSHVVIRIGELEVELEGEHSNVEKLMGEPLFKFIQVYPRTAKSNWRTASRGSP